MRMRVSDATQYSKPWKFIQSSGSWQWPNCRVKPELNRQPMPNSGSSRMNFAPESISGKKRWEREMVSPSSRYVLRR
jgi:hypothetical protein